MKIPTTLILCNSKYLRFEQRICLFAASRVRSKRERKNSCRDGELVRPGFCGALVSEETAGGRPIALVCAALRIGRGKLDVLFRAGAANGGAVVRSDAG